MANQRGLTLLWSNSKGFPRLTTTAPCLRQCQNTKQAWPPTFLSPALTIHTCHRTVTLSCFQGLIYCYLKNNPSIKCIRLRICELNGLILLTGKTKVRLRLVYFNYLLSRHERHLTHREQPLLKVYPPKSQKRLTTLEVKCSFACYRRSGIKKIWNKMFFLKLLKVWNMYEETRNTWVTRQTLQIKEVVEQNFIVNIRVYVYSHTHPCS